jgi:hypothetical protein
MNREEVFAPDEIAIVHVMNRVVRRCFLMGTDPDTGVNYDHRKVKMEMLFERFAGLFAIDLLVYSILSNHFHAVLRSRPDIVATWSDTEVARRWMLICPLRKEKDGTAKEPTEAELNTIRRNRELLAEIRTRLSDISWWMRLICQRIGMSANFEDEITGKFWQARFKAVRLLDEESLLACAAYVDLNPIRAAMAEMLESSDFTSVQRRIQALVQDPSRDRFLAPVQIDEQQDPIGAHPSKGPYRCSDKGFLAMGTVDYLELLDWTAREVVRGKRGHTPANVPPILQRLSLDVAAWTALVRDFGRMFHNAAGKPRSIDECRSRVGQRRFHVPRETRRILARCA